MRTSNSSARDEILRAAMSVLARANYAEISMQDIAKAGGVTKPTIYYYFESKQGLFEALSSMIVDHIRDIVLEEIAGSRGLSSTLEGIASRMLESPYTSPDLASALFAFYSDPSLKANVPTLRGEMEQIHMLLKDLFARGKADGVVREDVDVDLICRIYNSVIHSYLGMRLESGCCGGPGPVEIVRVLMQGVGKD